MGVPMSVRRTVALAALKDRGISIPIQRNRRWRENDPPEKTIADLTPEDFGRRVVIRSGDFLGTVCGTLLLVHPHPTLVAFTCVQLYGKKLLTFRNDMEVIVVDDLTPRDFVEPPHER
jgi:hypothetical protein